MLVDKAQSGTTFLTTRLTRKYWTSLDKFVGEKHSSLFCHTSSDEKRFTILTPGFNPIKRFYLCHSGQLS